ncbi:MAG: hypothetical protein H7138_13955 [Myxococcales bacterium]|nr:hypothetical protein [Myxococcales bacterium]
MSIDARLAYDVWLQLIADEELYRAMLEGTHPALAASRELDADKLAVLDAFRAEKGTRWNIENLRFRSALEAGDTLNSYLPRTMRLLTNGDENWLQDICFEYLSFYRWKEHGHYRFAECERFATYVRDRIMKRRVTPPHLEVALDFELGVVRLLKRTAQIAPEQWPVPPVLTDAQLAQASVRRAHAVALIDLPVDIRDWVEYADLSRGAVRPEPVTFLVYVPSLAHVHRIKILGEGPRIVLERFAGDRRCAAVAAELEAELGLEPAEVLGLVRTWLDERVLEVASIGPSA